MSKLMWGDGYNSIPSVHVYAELRSNTQIKHTLVGQSTLIEQLI